MKKFVPLLLIVLFIVLSINSCAIFKKEILRREQIVPPLTVELNSPNVQIGQIEAQFNRAFPLTGIQKRDINVSYYPYEDAVCLQFKLNTLTYNMFWHRAGRELFVKALAKYSDEFAAQKLTNRNNRTKSEYGTVENNYLIWYMSSFTTRAKGNMNTELGYYFRENSPFFAITLLEAYFTSPTLDKNDDQTSPIIPVFFTRSQAEELAAFFDAEYLRSLAPDMPQTIRRTNNDADYEEY